MNINIDITKLLLKLVIKKLILMNETINIFNNTESVVTILRDGALIDTFRMRFRYIVNQNGTSTRFHFETTKEIYNIDFQNDDTIMMVFKRNVKKVSYTGFLYVSDDRNMIMCNMSRPNKPSSILPISFRLLLTEGLLEIQDTSDTSSEESLLECTTNLVIKNIEKGIDIKEDLMCLPNDLRKKLENKLEKRSMRKNIPKYYD